MEKESLTELLRLLDDRKRECNIAYAISKDIAECKKEHYVLACNGCPSYHSGIISGRSLFNSMKMRNSKINLLNSNIADIIENNKSFFLGLEQ